MIQCANIRTRSNVRVDISKDDDVSQLGTTRRQTYSSFSFSFFFFQSIISRFLRVSDRRLSHLAELQVTRSYASEIDNQSQP